MIACSGALPPCMSSSKTLSKMPESLWPGWITGFSFSMLSPNSGEDMVFSRAFILLMLPRRVLISPLCAMKRKGCARGQDGKVFVL